jgi:serine/threonine-protein kinase RsbW
MAGQDRPAVSQPVEIVREARQENLGVLLQFVEHECSRAELPDDVTFAVRLATEEACSNIIAYAYPGRDPGPVSLQFTVDDDRVVIIVQDEGIRFEPSVVPPPDLTRPAEERPLGGLGWHLIQQVMDEVTHEHVSGRGNRLTLVKHLRHIGA